MRLVVKTKLALERLCLGVICIEKGKLNTTVIFNFEPMNHGRHCAAGRSGKAEEFYKLQIA